MLKYAVFLLTMLAVATFVLATGLLLTMPISLILLLAAVLADFCTTLLCLKEHGREGNPIIALLLKKLGVWGTFGLMGLFWVVLIVFRWLPATESVQTAVAVSYWMVPVNNALVLRKLKLIKKQRSKEEFV